MKVTGIFSLGKIHENTSFVAVVILSDIFAQRFLIERSFSGISPRRVTENYDFQKLLGTNF